MKVFLAAALALCTAVSAPALGAPKLRVGLHEKAPYVVRGEDGRWEGLAVELWEDVARRAGFDFEYAELPLEDLMPSLRDGRLDLVMGEFAVEPFYEKQIDFTQPFLTSSLGVAVPTGHWRPDWLSIARTLVNWSLIELLTVVVVGLVVVSVLIWFFERHRTGTHFPKKPLHGLGSALWFSTVTMTAVGYGDKTPSTPAGRLIAAIWMLAGTLIVAAFTGTVASAVSTARAEAEDSFSFLRLSKLQNGVLAGSTAEEILRDAKCPTHSFESVKEGLDQLGKGKIETFIADRISLDYVDQMYRIPNIRVLPDRFSSFTVAFGLPMNSPYRKQINVALLESIHSPAWTKTARRWLGPGHKDTPASLPNID